MDDDTIHISVWGQLRNDESLRKINKAVAEVTGRPVFSPHITLLGSQQHLTVEDAVSATKEVVKGGGLKPLKLSVKQLVLGPSYYQCVFLEVDPAEVLTKINESLIVHACAAHGIDYVVDPPFRPHISLAYGEPYQEGGNVSKDLAPIASALKCDLARLEKDKAAPTPGAAEYLGELVMDKLVVMNCPLQNLNEWSIFETIQL
eukprot:Gregarina_sp_Pseudo_9__1548@NODE_2039_length_1186_cov_17_042720_g1883_i0_p1_GENE_NODE_2039_length_1186_cov_17_042720_g1883_i0NODE_2039_length_1186_cov_17_042720_g1883_i0_p1_ORF_typecomplete_len220_score29_16CPDase/PF07823_11/2_7e192_5_RNA_ligase2/PF13563_6/9_9e10LigT_PEase/PF02834_16/0_49LigT_PEase/PF02834_16/21DUF1045/PF06299_12/3_5e02DUF1045/PF06299_12/9_2DUF1045/PF06299_12/48_NODE_2039_length_1186_cov_17_042720_g1883_i05271135